MAELEIKVKDLRKSYKGRCVVNGVSLSVSKGEVVGLLGPNGAGKTTTFYMTIGLVQPEGGEVWLGDTQITNFPMPRRAALGIGYLPQENSIFRRLTVEDNLKMIWEIRGVPAAEQEKRLKVLLAEFGLEKLRRQMAYALSGGERRRVEIARALATTPDFLLLDEPFTGIDPIAVDEIQKIIKALKEKGIGILITDHNVRDTLEITDRAYIISEGRIFVSGDSLTIAQDPLARKHYLGENFKIDLESLKQ
jgi:lipopolysaccharide export system ATP-binding protein